MTFKHFIVGLLSVGITATIIGVVTWAASTGHLPYALLGLATIVVLVAVYGIVEDMILRG